MPTLSIVIPAYNEDRELPELLQGIRAQTYQPIEVIVADAHSTDQTCKVATAFGARVVDGGLPAQGRNRGAKAASGDILLFLDADAKFPDKFFLERALAEFVSRRLDIACPDIQATRGRLARLFFSAYNTYTHLLLSIHPHVIGTCIFVRRVFHEGLGGFDEAIKLAEDNDYGVRASKRGSFGFLHELIFTPPRRFERDGYLRSAAVYTLSGIHVLFFGPIRSDLFHYRFGYKKKV
ncbi:glycosyltransferase [Candidatus Uhrbacteria bacterium]|nr:glycosyltransferase [Candidatus Uhrbacteria bacterium]